MGGGIENISAAARSLGYHGHIDPDDGSVVVYHPRHVHYLTHYPSGWTGD